MINFLSTMSSPLELFCNGHRVSVASCFLVLRNGATWVVTNWHVFSGRNPINGQPELGLAIPDSARVKIWIEKGGVFEPYLVSFPLIVDGLVQWRQSAGGQKIDIAVFELFTQDSLPGIMRFGSEHISSKYYLIEDGHFEISNEVFVIGFPKIEANDTGLPIWKRATIATEPRVDFNGSPSFLVDTLSSKGMSGSPVVLHSSGLINRPNIGSLMPIGIGRPIYHSQLVGIYSGRFLEEKDPLAPQLGRVWRIEEVYKIIENSVAGSYVLSPL